MGSTGGLMAVTHNFSESTDPLGGAWSDDNGKSICTWTWDHASRRVAVTCGNKGKTTKLPSFEAEMSGEQLRKHLARTALHLAEEINATKYES
ncbi:MAG: hypothetical protein QOK23_3034 [Gammaproteobacteria bacterium]|jgi:hypothetical protein|nr:hypothetical protein [Gammaproteobacteria bacterium]